MSTIGVISLGCAKNRVDSERMLGILSAAGHTFVQSPEDAEILIVNTCGFIESAKQESINTILEMSSYKSGKCRLLIVTGCLAQRYRSELAEAMPEIDILTGTREYEKLPALIAEKLGLVPVTTHASAGCRTPRILTTPSYSAYLRIGDGCNNRCTYCAIPLIRGPLVSEPIEDLVDEGKRLADGGVTELTVIAQDTSGYGRDLYGKPRLPELLERLTRIESLHWVRVLYTYPDTVTPTLIDMIRDNPKIPSYLDMPLQHVNDEILRRMNRRGDNRHIRSVMDYIEKNAPGFMLRTTMMVGFPGETDAQFQELMSFLKDHPFDRVGAFTFSPEEGTKAALMDEQISEEIKNARLDALMTQQATISRSRNENRIGSEVEVLIEGSYADGVYGRSYAEAPDVDGHIFLPGMQAIPGEYLQARLTEALEYDMIGEKA